MKAKVRADPEKLVDVELCEKKELMNDRKGLILFNVDINEFYCDFCHVLIENYPVKVIKDSTGYMGVCDNCFNKYYEII